MITDGFMALELEGEAVETVYPGFLLDHYSKGLMPAGVDPKQHTPKAVVDYIQQHGGHCVKLYYEEALWWPGDAPDFRLPSVAIVREVVAAAHSLDLPVVLHATSPNGHRLALESGVDVLAHGMWEWPDVGFASPEPTPEYTLLAKQVAQSEIRIQPTFGTLLNTASLFRPAVLADARWKNVVPPRYHSFLQGNVEKQRQTFLAMFDTAVGGFGWASPPGLSGYWEMLVWRNAGIPLKTLFRALTLENARAFRLDDEIGSIEVGKNADLLLLTANPLEDIEAYDSIVKVILGGQLFEREELSAVKLEH